jgi:hypothetical protein
LLNYLVTISDDLEPPTRNMTRTPVGEGEKYIFRHGRENTR